MSQAAESASRSLIDSLIRAIKDQLKYVWSYGTYIKDLNDVLTNLENARERRQEEVDRGNRNAEDIYVDVTKWLEDVNKITEEAAKVLEKHVNSKKGCCRGVIINPSTRFLIAKEAEANKQEIEKIQQRNNFQRVSHPQVPVGIVTGNYRGPRYWVAPSRASLLVDVSKALLDANIRMVGIYGASGVGKSVLLKQLEKQVQERKLNYDFDAVTMAIVSRSPNWEKVQDDLAYRLGLTLKEENTVDQKAIRLRERLSQKGKILLILDDICQKIDLEKLGIPFDDTHANIKVLLTSRFDQVLKSQMVSERNFPLHSLEAHEAVDLFRYVVGDRARDESTLIDQLAKECIGLPILISPLANSLKSLPSSDWVKALGTLRQWNNQETEKFIEESLEFNYYLMKSEEAKLLFLLCGQIGGQIISTRDLLLYGMGLGILKGVHTIEAAREKVELLLKNLKDSCLLEDHREGYVKIHDLMGNVALSIASKTHPSLVIRDGTMSKACSRDGFSECRSITLYHHDKMHELPERLICPRLKMLLLFATRHPTYVEITDAFFKDLGKLKVLDLSDFNMISLPSSMQFLGKLHTLCLDHVTIEDVAIIGKLKTLRCLTLRRSNISRIPKEIGELINLSLLDLRYCSSLRVIEPNVLGNLINVEELLLPISFDQWDAEGTSNASLTELNNMSSLCSLTICVPNAASIPIDLPFHQLVWFVINIGNKWDWEDDFIKPRTLKLEFDSKDSKLIWNERLQTTLKKTQDFYLHGWIGFEESITALSKEGFPELRHIHVEHCPSVQFIIHSNQPNAVPVLESLFLFGLTNLQKLCRSDHPHNCLKNLKVIKIEACDELKNLFSSSLVKSLPNLEEIDVSDCIMIQEIITYTEMDAIVDEQGGIANDEFEFVELKRLHKLELANLRNISSFCGKNKEIIEDDGSSLFPFFDGFQVSFPCLNSLTLRELPKLRAISHNQHPVQLHQLKSLELCKCESLLYAIDANLLLQLKNLESLTIDSCESMETIFNLEDLDACGFIFNQPLQIKLQKIEVSNCHKLKNLFSSSMVKFVEDIGHISVVSCMAMEEIVWEDNDDVQELQDGWVFPSLTHLSISNMENLKTFSYGKYYYQFPSLIEMMISSCPKMRTFVFAKHTKDETTMSEDVARDASFFNNKVALPSLEKLILRSLDSMISIWNNHLFEDSFCNLASIDIEKCARVLSIFPPHFLERLQNLTKVIVESCELLEVLFGYGHRKSIHCKLEELRLLDLPKLRYVVMKSHSSENAELSFSSLRDVFVKNCHNLINLFPNAIARNLSELANMHIVSCKALEEVVSSDAEEGDMALIGAMRFKKLTSLQLENLGSLVHFCSGHYELQFPFLKKLTICGCKELKAFVLRPSGLVRLKERSQDISSINSVEADGSPIFDEKVIFPSLQELQISGLVLKEIWPKNEPTSFQMDLKVFSVEGCHQLSTIFPSRMSANWHSLESLTVKSCNSLEVIFRLEKHISRRQEVLQHLRELTISSCEAMQCIVALGDDDYMGEIYYKTIIFSQLSSLKLSGLPRLGSFCPINHEIMLPSLAGMEVEDCKAIEVLFADSNQHYKPLFLVEKVEFPRMESMVIRDMQNLKELCHISKEGSHSECSSEAFCKLKRLEVEKCKGLLTIFPSEMIRAFSSLKSLSVRQCNSLESIFESPGLMSRPESDKRDDVVPMVFALREIHLWSLPQMTHVWNVVDPRWFYLSFEKLCEINIAYCGSLKHLFPASIARCLHQLFELYVLGCEGMEEIIWIGESADRQLLSTPSLQPTSFSLGMDPLEWPSLETLMLSNGPRTKLFASIQRKVSLPRLKELFTDASTLENPQFLDDIYYANPTTLVLAYVENKGWVESTPWPLLLEKFPNLQTLRVARSDSEEIFPPSYNDNEKEGVIVPYKLKFLDFAKKLEILSCHQLTILPLPLALFHNITELVVWECNGLRHLVTSFVARGLVQLTKLTICECNNLEEIVTNDYDGNGNIANDDDADISFPWLISIKLCDLPSLWSFSSTSYKFNFPSLRVAYMRDLPKMQVFCEGGFNTPYKHRITRGVRALYNREVKRCHILPGL